MSGAPTATTSPAPACRAVTVPACGEGSSTTALAVSTSAIVWLSVTVSPTLDEPRHELGLGKALAEVGQL